jgi:hypothetical protein
MLSLLAIAAILKWRDAATRVSDLDTIFVAVVGSLVVAAIPIWLHYSARARRRWDELLPALAAAGIAPEDLAAELRVLEAAPKLRRRLERLSPAAKGR